MGSTSSKNYYNLNPFDRVAYILTYGLYLIEVISLIESHETLMHVINQVINNLTSRLLMF
jgi:hypothetical protein